MRTLILTLLVASIGGSLFAQKAARMNAKEASPAEKARMKTEHMAKELSLTEEQKEKVLRINLNHYTKLQNIKQDKMRQQSKIKAEVDMAQEKHRDELNKVLTEEQLALMKKKKDFVHERDAKRKKHMGERNHKHPHPPKPPKAPEAPNAPESPDRD